MRLAGAPIIQAVGCCRSVQSITRLCFYNRLTGQFGYANDSGSEWMLGQAFEPVGQPFAAVRLGRLWACLLRQLQRRMRPAAQRDKGRIPIAGEPCRLRWLLLGQLVVAFRLFSWRQVHCRFCCDASCATIRRTTLIAVRRSIGAHW